MAALILDVTESILKSPSRSWTACLFYFTRLKVTGSRTRESSRLLPQNDQKSHDFSYDQNRSISTA